MAATNLSKLRKKLVPQPDGQDVLRLRTGVVVSVNADGTVDVTVSSVTLTGLPRLDGLLLAEGETVQIVSYRGSLLVLGRVAGSAPSSGAARTVYKTDTANPTWTGSTTFTVTSSVFGLVFVAPPSGSVKVTVEGWIGNNSVTVSQRTYMTGQIREGNSINSGTIVDTAIDNQSGIYDTTSTAVGTKYAFATTVYPVDGLTPGDEYNLTWLGRITASGSTGAAFTRRMMVEPFDVIPSIL